MNNRKILLKHLKVCQYCKNENTRAEKTQYDDNSYSGMFQVCACGWKKPLFIIEKEAISIEKKGGLSIGYKYGL